MDLQQRFSEIFNQHKVPGAAFAVYRDGAIQDIGHHGICNSNTGVEVDERTIFHIGSNTKVFNATLIMQAVDEGLLKLDDPVQKFLPDFYLSDPEAAKAVTVKMLINHTSSIDCDMFAQPEFDKDRVVDGYRSVLGATSLFPPGEEQGYSNGATLVAGHLIQTVRERGWYELIRERIYQPLEMHNAIAHPSEALDFRFAKGHVTNPETGVLEASSCAYLPGGMAPAGSTLSMTAEDQAAFAAMHLRNGLGLNGARILSEASAKAMRQVTAKMSVGGFTSSFGLGWGIGFNGIVRHAGAGIGTSAQLILHEPSGTALSLMANADIGMAAIAEFAKEFLVENFNADPAAHYIPKPEQPDLHISPEPVCGRYTSGVAWWEISHADGQFILAGGPSEEGIPNFETPSFSGVPLVPLDETSFMAKPEDPARLGSFGMFLTMPVGVAGNDGQGRYQRFLAGTRVYARV